MEVYKKLMKIQSQLKAPKGQFNSFGKYSYRNCEDILEAVKPLLAEVGAVLTVSDAVINIEQRFYIEATAKFIDVETGDTIENKALAREDETKKGMDLSQVTGSTSSYARKYALNGLFCIDDTKDSDATNTHDKTSTQGTGAKNNLKGATGIDEAKVATIKAVALKKGITEDYICKFRKCTKYEELTLEGFTAAMDWLKKQPNKEM